MWGSQISLLMFRSIPSHNSHTYTTILCFFFFIVLSCQNIYSWSISCLLCLGHISLETFIWLRVFFIWCIWVSLLWIVLLVDYVVRNLWGAHLAAVMQGKCAWHGFWQVMVANTPSSTIIPVVVVLGPQGMTEPPSHDCSTENHSFSFDNNELKWGSSCSVIPSSGFTMSNDLHEWPRERHVQACQILVFFKLSNICVSRTSL